MVTTVKPVYIK